MKYVEVPVNSLVPVADLHSGCQLGLLPGKGFRLDDGGWYKPNPFQKWLWRCWLYFWDQWVPLATREDDYGVVLLGDALEGRHHQATTQWTHNLATQADAAYEILAPIVAKCEGRYWHVRGTEAHSGPAGEQEEMLAKRLGGQRNPEGKYAWDELWKWVGPNHAILVHLLHHIGGTSSQAYEATAVHKEYTESCVAAAKQGLRAPDFIVRAHRHRFIRTEVSTWNERGVGLVLPGWQGKTPLTYRMALARLSPPEVGGAMIRYSEEGEPYARHWVKGLKRPKAV